MNRQPASYINNVRLAAAIALFCISLFIAPPTEGGVRLKLATTTSVENSGLLNLLLPAFQEKMNVKVDVIAVGSGRALKLAETGDVDVVISHDPEAEAKLVQGGYAIDRKQFMENDFVLIGPEADPAGIASARDITEALARIAEKRAPFLSRGDNSGTDRKEKALWEKAGIRPWEGDSRKWYLETGASMEQVLLMSRELQGYTLSDRGTFIYIRHKLSRAPRSAGLYPPANAKTSDPLLKNRYSIMAANPKLHPHVKYDLAKALIDFVTSAEGQNIIGSHQVNGEKLFQPIP